MKQTFVHLEVASTSRAILLFVGRWTTTQCHSRETSSSRNYAKNHVTRGGSRDLLRGVENAEATGGCAAEIWEPGGEAGWLLQDCLAVSHDGQNGCVESNCRS